MNFLSIGTEFMRNSLDSSNIHQKLYWAKIHARISILPFIASWPIYLRNFRMRVVAVIIMMTASFDLLFIRRFSPWKYSSHVNDEIKLNELVVLLSYYPTHDETFIRFWAMSATRKGNWNPYKDHKTENFYIKWNISLGILYSNGKRKQL